MTNNLWYWSPTVATYVFSVIVIFETIRSSEKFLLFRKRYYLKCEQLAKEQMSCSSPTQLLQHQKEDLISRTLLVHFEYATLQDQLDQTASTFTASDDMKALIDSMTKSPCEQVLIGKYNSKLYHLIKDYNEVIKKMERHLNSYLYLVKTQQLRTPLEAGRPSQCLVVFCMHTNASQSAFVHRQCDTNKTTYDPTQLEINEKDRCNQLLH